MQEGREEKQKESEISKKILNVSQDTYKAISG